MGEGYGRDAEKYPKVTQHNDTNGDDDRVIFFRLVKGGYGNYFEVQNMTMHEVTQALHFESFISEYVKAYGELNREKK